MDIPTFQGTQCLSAGMGSSVQVQSAWLHQLLPTTVFTVRYKIHILLLPDEYLKFYQSHKRCINQHLWFENVARGKFHLDSCGQAMAGQGSTPKCAS